MSTPTLTWLLLLGVPTMDTNWWGFPEADPGFFLGGGAPVRNDVTDGEVKKLKANTYIQRRKLHLRGQ